MENNSFLYITNVVKFYFKWCFNYMAHASIVTLGFVIPFTIITGNSFLYSWEWFHREVMVPYLWFFAPVFTILVIILINLTNRGTSIRIFNLKNYPYFFHKLVFFIYASIIIGGISQVFGGCVWQLPIIWDGWYGYAWERFGYELFPDWILLIFYFTVTLLSFALLHMYFSIITKAYKTSIITSR